MRPHVVVLLAVVCASGATARPAFVNFESGHVHPLDVTPNAQRLLAVNTADNTLEVFSIAAGAPVWIGSIPVGLDPVSVRARNDGEAWVVNRISDSVSIVDLTTLRVRATIFPGDEPGDVVFAGAPARAFVSVSGENALRVFDPGNLAAAPTLVTIQGEHPRALETDGSRVFAAIFESGNKTTILGQAVVSGSLNPYSGRPNPPPNAGTAFSPPIRAGLPVAPAVSLIVKQRSDGTWRDDNNGNWTPAVTWGLHDNDVAIVNASTLAVTYARGLMNANMALAIGPGGQVTVVGTDATNEIRFEPNVKSRFLRVLMGRFDPASPAATTVTDLNPHLNYSVQTTTPGERAKSVGDPRAIVWNSARTRGYVAGMGSNSLIVIDQTGARIGAVDVPSGPTGLALVEPANRLYVLSRFAGVIASIDTATLTEQTTARRGFFDSTPAVIKSGRPFLYETRTRSGLGHVSCASCHIDGGIDFLAWDLGDPSGTVKTFNQVCNFGAGGCENWHPMKGPMTTQTLFGLVNVGPLHWRGDRENVAAFNPAFVSLLGADAPLSAAEMNAFSAFVATLTFPPSPNRNLDNSLRTSFPNGGNPANGLNLYNTVRFDGGIFTCVQCHALPTGTNGQLTSANALQESQSMKIPQLRNMFPKAGFDKVSLSGNRGFGFTHDGSVDTLFNFLLAPVFSGFAAGQTGVQQRKDIEAFLMSFSTDTHAAVGVQTTLVSAASASPAQLALIDSIVALADQSAVGVVVKGRFGGVPRGWAYSGGGVFQSDRQAETATLASLKAAAAPGAELTFTAVPRGSETRLGVDRDGDGFLDRDEILAGSDPVNPASVPGVPCPGDVNRDRIVDFTDLNAVLSAFGSSGTPGIIQGDLTGDGLVDFADLNTVLSNFGRSC